MFFKKQFVKKSFERDFVPINSSDGTINISHNLENISNISLTLNNCSQNMYQFKKILLLMLFGISIVNFTLTILNTQNIAVNNTILQQVNTTTAIFTKDVFRISNKLSEMESWKYILNLTKYFDELVPQTNYFQGLFHQISELFTSICVYVSTKPKCLVPIFGICTQIILLVNGKAARFRNLLGCLLWGCSLYLQEQRTMIEDDILSRVFCSTFILFLTVQILLTSEKEVKVYNLNITDTSPKSSKISINKRNLFAKDTNKTFELNNVIDTKNINFFNNLDQNNVYRSNENLFLSNESKSLFNEPLKFDNLIKTSPKNIVGKINTNPLDTYCDSLKNLKLSTNANLMLNNKVNPHFMQKEYGVKKVSDIFVKKSVLLSPTRFQKISQESWVAGGYWKQYDQCEFVTSQLRTDQILYKNLTPLSRSSSQSSGFSSQSDQNSLIESTNSFRTSVVNSKFFLPQYDDRLSVRSEPAYHSNI